MQIITAQAIGGKSRLIESFMLKIQLPYFYAAATPKAVWENGTTRTGYSGCALTCAGGKNW
jgi:hypothetical protein